MALELTGTRDGKLFGFIRGSSASLVRIDEASAAFSDNVDLSALGDVSGFAFSF